MGSSPGFGSAGRHAPRGARPVRTRRRSGSGPHGLNPATPSNSPAHSSIGTPSHDRFVLRLLGGARFQALGTPLPGSFPPFPHGTVRYRSLRVGSLGRWAPQLHAGLLVSGATQEPSLRPSVCPDPALTVCGDAFQASSGQRAARSGARQPALLGLPTRLTHRLPAVPRHAFGLPPVRSPLLRGSCLFLGVREMFQFPRCPPHRVMR